MSAPSQRHFCDEWIPLEQEVVGDGPLFPPPTSSDGELSSISAQVNFYLGRVRLMGNTTKEFPIAHLLDATVEALYERYIDDPSTITLKSSSQQEEDESHLYGAESFMSEIINMLFPTTKPYRYSGKAMLRG